MFKSRFPVSLALAIVATPAVATMPDGGQQVAQCLASHARDTPEQEFELFYKLQARGPAAMQNATRIYYGKKLDQYGDLRLPNGPGPFPVAIVVHGGNWQAVANSDYMAPVAELLTKAGIATWNIEYSRLGSGGGWPNSFLSVGAAADHVRELAQKYPLDLNRIISVGHSSGGHFALWMAARHKIRTSSDIFMADPVRLKGVLSLDGSADIKAHGDLPRGRGSIPQLVGSNDPAVAADRFKDISPVNLLPLGAREIIFTQDSDRLKNQVEFVTRARSLGDQAKYEILCPANHFTVVDTENRAVREKLLTYAAELLQP